MIKFLYVILLAAPVFAYAASPANSDAAPDGHFYLTPPADAASDSGVGHDVSSEDGSDSAENKTDDSFEKLWSQDRGNTAHRARLQAVLERSVFNTDDQPESLAEGAITTYNPMLIAIASSLRSRLPARNEDEWKQISLPPVGDPQDVPFNICPHPFKAFVKRSNTESPYTFVILPGAYATWKRGSFNNQTIAVLEKRFNNPTIISFAGYLSPDFLKGVCDKIPWDGRGIAGDFYLRLRNYLAGIKADPKYTGLIGFSGGAGLTVGILGFDSENVNNGLTYRARVFGLGGASFSPTLHGVTIFNNLDESVKYIKHSRVLTTVRADLKEVGHLWFLAKSLVSNDFGPDWRDVVDYYEEDPQNFLERSFNEFTLDLEYTLNAVGFDPEQVKGKLSYYNAYVATGAEKDKPDYYGMKDMATENFYNQIADIRPFFKAIDRPLLIYASQDDPILSSYDNSGQPPEITDILKQAADNPYITVFNPQYGGHTGALLDPVFEELISALFSKEDEKNPPSQH